MLRKTLSLVHYSIVLWSPMNRLRIGKFIIDSDFFWTDRHHTTRSIYQSDKPVSRGQDWLTAYLLVVLLVSLVTLVEMSTRLMHCLHFSRNKRQTRSLVMLLQCRGQIPWKMQVNMEESRFAVFNPLGKSQPFRSSFLLLFSNCNIHEGSTGSTENEMQLISCRFNNTFIIIILPIIGTQVKMIK